MRSYGSGALPRQARCANLSGDPAYLFLSDYAYFRLRMIHPTPADPLETVTAPRLYAIAEKGRKVAYELDAQNPEQTLVCAHSLFPHGGYSPCWYLIPKSQKPIPM
ncbi:MAG: hypothetical protein M3P45_01010 [Acidobacteriota bacterium]|nr:hypothetical protein [Acidobacteriota bacterium]